MNVCIIILGALCASGLLETVHAGETNSPAKTTLVSLNSAPKAKNGGSLAFLNTKISFVASGKDKSLNRHFTPFSGPPGPTLPYGANLNPVRAAKAELTVLRYAGESAPYIYDFPPGAKLQQIVAVQQ